MSNMIRTAILLFICSLPACTTAVPHAAATQNAWSNTFGDGGGGGGGGGGGM